MGRRKKIRIIDKELSEIAHDVFERYPTMRSKPNRRGNEHRSVPPAIEGDFVNGREFKLFAIPGEQFQAHREPGDRELRTNIADLVPDRIEKNYFKFSILT